MARSLTLLTVALLFAAGGPGVCADDDASSGESTTSPGQDLSDSPSPSDQARHAAITQGLAWLAATQAENPDGSFPRGKAREWAPIGVTSLCTLAFMAGGSSPHRGPHGRETALAVDYLLAHADLAPGSKQYGYISNQGDQLSRMHGHGFATLALAEAYGMTPNNLRLKQALVAAVGTIERSQSPEGGWYYEPRPSGHEGSVTICLVQALRAARNAGLRVDPQVILRAEDYVLALKNEAGLFRYQLDREDASVALTAAAISTLNAAGRYDGAVIQESVDAIWSGLELRREKGGSVKFPHYERLYLAQALFQLSDQSGFVRWFDEQVPRLLGAQRSNGSWRDGQYGDAYATAINVLVLALPDGMLPIFQR